MAILETSVTIGKPVEKVFEYITNLDNQKKLSTYITGIEVDGPVKLGTKYKIETTSMGHKNVTTNEVVSFEPNKKFGVKTFAAPPASDLTNTYLLEKDGSGTKLILQMDAVLVPAGMPNMPGMEDMMKTQMKAGLDSTMAALKKAIEG
ncbi:MAG TPA: SRPBCC family protein [Anaerolineales bacterium]|nr:SRPBCC family protein [Anaerolineales bacterium]